MTKWGKMAIERTLNNCKGYGAPVIAGTISNAQNVESGEVYLVMDKRIKVSNTVFLNDRPLSYSGKDFCVRQFKEDISK